MISDMLKELVEQVIKDTVDEQGYSITELTDDQLMFVASMPVSAGIQAESRGGDPINDSQLVLQVLKNILHRDLHERLADGVQTAINKSVELGL